MEQAPIYVDRGSKDYSTIKERKSIMDFSKIQPFIPYLVPVLVIQLILLVTALVDLIRREHTRGPKWVWVLVILLRERDRPHHLFRCRPKGRIIQNDHH